MNYNRLIYCSREEGRRWVEEQERRELGEDKMNKKGQEDTLEEGGGRKESWSRRRAKEQMMDVKG